MNIEIKENERIDDLQFKGLKIIQNKKGFCFGIDSILLSDFAKSIKKDAYVMDLGTGTGIIPILLCEKTPLKKVVGVEIQQEVCEMAQRSIYLNKLENKFEIINTNILALTSLYNKESFDVIVSNPPYKKINTGVQNQEIKKNISRHELTASLEDFIQTSFTLLKDRGEIYIVHRPERLVDLLSLMRNYQLEPKEMRMVYSNQKKPPCLVLIKGVKRAKYFLKILPNLYIYDECGKETKEIREIYHRDN